MLLTEKTNNTVTFGKSKQKSVSFVERFISIFILLLSLRIHEQQQLVLSGDLSRPVSLADLTAVPWKRFMLTKSEKYEDHIFFLTLSCLTVPVLYFHKKSKGRIRLLWKIAERLGLANCPVSDVALPEAVSLMLFGSAQLSGEIKHRGLVPLLPKAAHSRKEVYIILWIIHLSGNLDPLFL